MKLLNKIFFVILISIPAHYAVFAQDCRSVLNVITDNDSARIYINGNLSGIGKTELELEKGIYVVKAEEPPPVWNARILTDTVNLTGCNKTQIIHFTFASYRYINSSPQDASVFAHDSLIGYTPLFISAGYKEAELTKDGYDSKKFSPESLPYGKTITLKFTGTPEGKHFFRKDIFKYLVGGIVVLGGVTAYFKLKADNRFSEYQATGTQSKLDETRKYDLISGIAMGGLEINFGLLIYYFLTD